MPLLIVRATLGLVLTFDNFGLAAVIRMVVPQRLPWVRGLLLANGCYLIVAGSQSGDSHILDALGDARVATTLLVVDQHLEGRLHRRREITLYVALLFVLSSRSLLSGLPNIVRIELAGCFYLIIAIGFDAVGRLRTRRRVDC